MQKRNRGSHEFTVVQRPTQRESSQCVQDAMSRQYLTSAEFRVQARGRYGVDPFVATPFFRLETLHVASFKAIASFFFLVFLLFHQQGREGNMPPAGNNAQVHPRSQHHGQFVCSVLDFEDE